MNKRSTYGGSPRTNGPYSYTRPRPNTAYSNSGDLVVRVGRPEVVIPELARAAGAEAVYAHGESSINECHAEVRLRKAVEKEGIEVKYFWDSMLYHVEDLP